MTHSLNIMFPEGYGYFDKRWLFDERIKNELKILLYVSNLCSEKGFCRAGNKHIAEKFKTTPQTVSVKIKRLEKLGFLKMNYQMNGQIIIKRTIWLGNEELTIKENLNGAIKENLNGAIKENLKDNITSSNNITNMKESPSSEQISEMTPRQELQEKVNKIISAKKVPNARTDKSRIILEFYMRMRKSQVKDFQSYLNDIQKLLGAVEFKDVLGAMWICHHTKFSRGLTKTGNWKWDINYLFRKGKIDQAYKWEGDVVNELIDENSKKLEADYGYLFEVTYEKQKISVVIDGKADEQIEEEERISNEKYSNLIAKELST